MIKIGIVEDRKEIREALQMLLNAHPSFECLHVFETGEEAVENLPKHILNVVLMDIHLPGMNGIETLKMLRTVCPEVQFMMCTVYEDDESIFESLKAGAIGYITKSTTPEKLYQAIIEMVEGGSPMSPVIARKVLDSFYLASAPNSDLLKLSKREVEIMGMLSKGLRYKEVASELFISTETVRTHIRRIYEKLEVGSRTEALNKLYPKG